MGPFSVMAAQNWFTVKNGIWEENWKSWGIAHTTPTSLKKAFPIVGFLFEKNSYDYQDVIVFQKLHSQNVSRPHKNTMSAFSNTSALKSVFERLRFRNRLIWTLDLTVEIKAAFFNFSSVEWGLR